MPRDNYADLVAFVAVARDRSFTRAAARLGISQSALSQTVKALEARVGVRLLTRTTRSVSPTEAGERLLSSVAPRFDEIDAQLAAVGELRNVPTGTIRITASDYAAETVLWPKLDKFLARYPEVRAELVVDNGLSDIVAERFDIGVRQGDGVAKDMIAVRIGPDMRFIVVGAPAYLAKHAPPKSPQDLTQHDCIMLRLPTRGGLYAWELRKGKREVRARVEGRLVFNGVFQTLKAAVAGFGLAFVPEDIAHPYIAEGKLKIVLEPWCPTFDGLHIYYPDRRQASRAMELLIEELRYRA